MTWREILGVSDKKTNSPTQYPHNPQNPAVEGNCEDCGNIEGRESELMEALANASGMTVQRTRSDGYSLVEAARSRQVRFVASMDDRFGFPRFQPHFDGLFSAAKIMELSARAGLSLDQAFAKLPQHAYHHLQLPCPWESKGGLMRRMSEDAVDQQASFIDGVRIDTDRGWVLVLPDQHRPIAHIYVEAIEQADADSLRDQYQRRVSAWLQELADN